MNSKLLKSKKVLAICMETTAGGRNYSGGLGALYGDTTRTMYRENATFIAITPLYKNGYVRQTVTSNQVIDEFPTQDFNTNYLDTGMTFYVPVYGKNILVKVWQNKEIPIAYGLDTDLPENDIFANITNNLYGEDGFNGFNGEEQRLMQEIITGVGAIKLAQLLNYDFDIIHLNEGHGVFAPIYYLSETLKNNNIDFDKALLITKNITVFTTHTPISVGNKIRPIDMIMKFGANFNLSYDQIKFIGGDSTGTMFGSTTASLRLSKIANAVALRHQSTSHELWKDVDNSCPITYIDNGVDIDFWQSPSIRLAYNDLNLCQLFDAHIQEKAILINEIKKRNNISLNPSYPIIGFARRVIEYKRADLIFEDVARFEQLIEKYHVQFVFSGKTHPKDNDGKAILIKLYNYSLRYPNNVIFLQNYDVEIASLMTKGSDIWLGNPQIPLEACSTSGMKAASNGIVNLSTADGWWYKSARFSLNGWTIGESKSHDKYTDSQYLYKILEEKVLPTFKDKIKWTQMMFNSIYTALEECSTKRMIYDYYVYIYNAPEIK